MALVFPPFLLFLFIIIYLSIFLMVIALIGAFIPHFVFISIESAVYFNKLYCCKIHKESVIICGDIVGERKKKKKES